MPSRSRVSVLMARVLRGLTFAALLLVLGAGSGASAGLGSGAGGGGGPGSGGGGGLGTDVTPAPAVLALVARPGKTDVFSVVITETVYVDSKKSTTIYRQDVRVTSSHEGDEIRQNVAVVGSVMSEGQPLRTLGGYSFSLLVGRDAKIVSAEGLHPWDGRVIETLWLGQIMLPGSPVAVGDSWTVDGAQIGTGHGLTVLERRSYKLTGYQSVGDLRCAVIDYQITNRGKYQDSSYTYICKGQFLLGDGRVVRLTSSEVVSIFGTTVKKKALTTVQVDSR